MGRSAFYLHIRIFIHIFTSIFGWFYYKIVFSLLKIGYMR